MATFRYNKPVFAFQVVLMAGWVALWWTASAQLWVVAYVVVALTGWSMVRLLAHFFPASKIGVFYANYKQLQTNMRTNRMDVWMHANHRHHYPKV